MSYCRRSFDTRSYDIFEAGISMIKIQNSLVRLESCRLLAVRCFKVQMSSRKLQRANSIQERWRESRSEGKYKKLFFLYERIFRDHNSYLVWTSLLPTKHFSKW